VLVFAASSSSLWLVDTVVGDTVAVADASGVTVGVQVFDPDGRIVGAR